MVGTLEALALTQMVPEHSREILGRLDDYMQNRVVCGVNYPSDVAASRIIASSLFGLIAASFAFQKELAAARVEVRSLLGLPQSPALSQDYLANNTALIMRHAEKPSTSTGGAGLSEVGEHRAEAYINYLQPFRESGMRLKVSALYAGADSASSIRPRLTLEPLSKASGIPLDTTISTKDPRSLVAFLRTHAHVNTPLICWRHGQIPALLAAFGVAPESVLPGGKWPMMCTIGFLCFTSIPRDGRNLKNLCTKCYRSIDALCPIGDSRGGSCCAEAGDDDDAAGGRATALEPSALRRKRTCALAGPGCAICLTRGWPVQQP